MVIIKTFWMIGKIVLGLWLGSVASNVPSQALVDYRIFRSLPPPASPVQASFTYVSAFPNLVYSSPYRVVIDVSDNREFLYRGDQLIKEIVVSTGSSTRYDIAYHTPLGLWKIVSKEKSSGVYGPYFLRLAYWNGTGYVSTSIGLHGTDEPELLGQDASHGCIRHRNEVITELYSLLPLGTIVETVE